eukprot:45068-Eustigmatos_ZCMA.PRE.1
MRTDPGMRHDLLNRRPVLCTRAKHRADEVVCEFVEHEAEPVVVPQQLFRPTLCEEYEGCGCEQNGNR